MQNGCLMKPDGAKRLIDQEFGIYEVSQEDGMQTVREDKAESLTLSLDAGDAVLLRFQDSKETAYLIDYVLDK